MGIARCKFEMAAKGFLLQHMRTGAPIDTIWMGMDFRNYSAHAELCFLVASGEYDRALELCDTITQSGALLLRCKLICHVNSHDIDLAVDCIGEAMEKYSWNDNVLEALEWASKKLTDGNVQDFVSARKNSKSAMLIRVRSLVGSRDWPEMPKQPHGLGWCESKVDMV